ncbi:MULTISPECIES: hypothetical protein [Dyella]|uniref:Uncharacterized protein n=2 Tax=Dyella TaxID=231454 RepID=A0A4R0YJ35_9GAMM|nr:MULTISPECIES: hypothetical protein [Dyella]TBR36479.1 hypothetical protein EYV96_11075 [Dyella terrae]TCI08429.1 hypothetical protein EZM97_27795 [Dyella soli]
MKRFLAEKGWFDWIRKGRPSAVVAAYAVGTASATGTAPPQNVPANVRALMEENDTILAFREQSNLFGDEALGAIAAIRHGTERGRSWEENPCDLVILRRQGDHWIETARSNRIVDCVYNHYSYHAPEMALNAQLTSAPLTVEFYSQKVRGYDAYSLTYLPERSNWRLGSATSTYREFDRDGLPNFVKEQVSFPETLPLTLLKDIDQESISDLLSEHRVPLGNEET